MGVSLAGLDLGEVTAAEFLLELRRIADALEKPAECDGRKDDAACALSFEHVGYHVSDDGRLHWFDE